VKGVFYQIMKDTIIYQKSVPLYFIVDLPEINTTLYTDTECLSEPQLCTLKSEAGKIHNAILKETLKNQPYLNPESSTSGSLRRRRGLMDGVGKIDKYLFGLATTADVDALHESEVAMAHRIKSIQEALVDEHKYMISVTSNITAWSKDLSESFEKRIKTVQNALVSTIGTVFEGEAVLGQIQVLLMKNQYFVYVTTKVNEAANSCRNNRIPRGVLSNNNIQLRLTELTKQLMTEDYELATDVQGIMKMDIADCSFSRSQLHITLHIPLKVKKRKYELFEVLAVPYQYGQQQCSVMQTTPFVVQVGESIMPISGHVARYCRPQEKNFCFIPENEKDSSSFSECAKALFRLSTSDIKKVHLSKFLK